MQFLTGLIILMNTIFFFFFTPHYTDSACRDMQLLDFFFIVNTLLVTMAFNPSTSLAFYTHSEGIIKSAFFYIDYPCLTFCGKASMFGMGRGGGGGGGGGSDILFILTCRPAHVVSLTRHISRSMWTFLIS